jgi:hypothetical protein
MAGQQTLDVWLTWFVEVGLFAARLGLPGR